MNYSNYPALSEQIQIPRGSSSSPSQSQQSQPKEFTRPLQKNQSQLKSPHQYSIMEFTFNNPTLSEYLDELKQFKMERCPRIHWLHDRAEWWVKDERGKHHPLDKWQPGAINYYTQTRYKPLPYFIAGKAELEDMIKVSLAKIREETDARDEAWRRAVTRRKREEAEEEAEYFEHESQSSESRALRLSRLGKLLKGKKQSTTRKLPTSAYFLPKIPIPFPQRRLDSHRKFARELTAKMEAWKGANPVPVHKFGGQWMFNDKGERVQAVPRFQSTRQHQAAAQQPGLRKSLRNSWGAGEEEDTAGGGSSEEGAYNWKSVEDLKRSKSQDFTYTHPVEPSLPETETGSLLSVPDAVEIPTITTEAPAPVFSEEEFVLTNRDLATRRLLGESITTLGTTYPAFPEYIRGQEASDPMVGYMLDLPPRELAPSSETLDLREKFRFISGKLLSLTSRRQDGSTADAIRRLQQELILLTDEMAAAASPVPSTAPPETKRKHRRRQAINSFSEDVEPIAPLNVHHDFNREWNFSGATALQDSKAKPPLDTQAPIVAEDGLIDLDEADPCATNFVQAQRPDTSYADPIYAGSEENSMIDLDAAVPSHNHDMSRGIIQDSPGAHVFVGKQNRRTPFIPSASGDRDNTNLSAQGERNNWGAFTAQQTTPDQPSASSQAHEMPTNGLGDHVSLPGPKPRPHEIPPMSNTSEQKKPGFWKEFWKKRADNGHEQKPPHFGLETPAAPVIGPIAQMKLAREAEKRDGPKSPMVGLRDFLAEYPSYPQDPEPQASSITDGQVSGNYEDQTSYHPATQTRDVQGQAPCTSSPSRPMSEAERAGPPKRPPPPPPPPTITVYPPGHPLYRDPRTMLRPINRGQGSLLNQPQFGPIQSETSTEIANDDNPIKSRWVREQIVRNRAHQEDLKPTAEAERRAILQQDEATSAAAAGHDAEIPGLPASNATGNVHRQASTRQSRIPRLVSNGAQASSPLATTGSLMNRPRPPVPRIPGLVPDDAQAGTPLYTPAPLMDRPRPVVPNRKQSVASSSSGSNYSGDNPVDDVTPAEGHFNRRANQHANTEVAEQGSYFPRRNENTGNAGVQDYTNIVEDMRRQHGY